MKTEEDVYMYDTVVTGLKINDLVRWPESTGIKHPVGLPKLIQVRQWSGGPTKLSSGH